MTDIKSIPPMSKAELIKEVERLATLVRSQSAAMTELGNLSDTQQAQIGALHAIIEAFWINQCASHACGCGEWPECVHTIHAAEMRAAAMSLEQQPYIERRP